MRRDGSERSVTLRVTTDRRALTEPGKLLPGLGFDLATWNAATMVGMRRRRAAPAARAGLRAGDRLLAVDGQPIANSSAFRSPGRRRGESRHLASKSSAAASDCVS